MTTHIFSRYLRLFLPLAILLGGIASARHNADRGERVQLPAPVQFFTDTQALMQRMQEVAQWAPQYPDSGVRFYLQALEESEQALFVPGVNTALMHIGNLYAVQGRFDESAALFRNTLYVCSRSSALWPCLPTAYNNLGTVCETQSRYREAATCYYRAIWLGERLHVASTGGVYNNLGAVLISLEQYNEALHYLDRAEVLATRGRNYPILGNVRVNKGLVYLTQHQWDRSRASFLAALELGRDQGLPQAEQQALTGLGCLYLERKMPAKALEYLLQTDEVKGPVAQHYLNAAYENTGKAYQQLRKYAPAEHYLLKALRLAEELKLEKKRSEIHQLLSQLYEEQHLPQKALDHHKAFAALRDSIASREVIGEVQQMNIRYRTAEKDKDITRKQMLIAEQNVHLKQKNIWIGITAAGALLITVLLISFYRNARHRQQLQDKQIRILEQGQEISRLKAMMQGEEKERARLAQELHDGIGGMLAAIKMNFSTLQHQYRHHDPQREFLPLHDLEEISGMLDETSREIRKTAHNLMPDTLLQHGLQATIMTFCEKVNAGDQVYVNLQINASLDALSQSFSLALYRIIQELLQNILKHSGASNALVQIDQDAEQLVLTIKDNGRGFDPLRHSDGLGMQNVQSRIAAFRGQLHIHSAPEKGTLLSVAFDLENIQKN